MSTTIYSLADPDTRETRYIGKTVRLKRRYYDHVTESVKKQTHLGNWLRSLKGEKPRLIILCEVPDELGASAEIIFIKKAREGGFNLVNATDGGEGVTFTEETREKISLALRGRCLSPESRAKISKAISALPGRPISQETRAKISASHKKRVANRRLLDAQP